MLHLPEPGSRTATIVGLDPGSENLGFATLEFDIETMTIIKTTACTIIGSKLMRHNTWSIELHGERLSRIKALKTALLNLLLESKPIQIGCESPFFNMRRPSAYGVLIEVLLAIKEAVQEYDSWKIVYLIDPPTVKKSVNAPGNGDKIIVKQNILALTDINYQGITPLEKLDEHSLDAIAVAYCKFKDLLK